MTTNAKLFKIKALYDQAARANLTEPYRRGQLVELPAKGDLLATGDLHGNERNFEAILERADLEHNPARHLMIQEVTHVLEVGPDTSSVVIEGIAKLKCKFPDRVHFLLGNHEHAELTGQEILKGGVCLNILFRQSLINQYGEEAADQVREAILGFFRSMPLAIRTPNRVFMVHTTPPARYVDRFPMAFFLKNGDEIWRDPARKMLYQLLWARDYNPEAAKKFAAGVDADVLLVGHKPCPKGFEVPNDTHIIIDCKDPRAKVVHFRLDQPITHGQLVERIERLHRPS